VTKIQAGLSTYAGGAVASVTGNVGGNVTGSVGSVVGAVGSVTAAVTVGTNNDKTGYALSGAGVTAVQAGLSTVTTAQVNAEVLDVLTVDTFAEPAAVVAATASLKDKIGWLAILARNKRQTTATSDVVRAAIATLSSRRWWMARSTPLIGSTSRAYTRASAQPRPSRQRSAGIRAIHPSTIWTARPAR
jgi:hypothetical protein